MGGAERELHIQTVKTLFSPLTLRSSRPLETVSPSVPLNLFVDVFSLLLSCPFFVAFSLFPSLSPRRFCLVRLPTLPLVVTRQHRNRKPQMPKSSDPLAGVAGVNVRDSFSASKSFTLMAADYSQIEVRAAPFSPIP